MNITKENIRDIDGRLVRWTVPAYKDNAPVGGLADIIFISPEDSHPIHSNKRTRNSLDYAFWDGNDLCYGDGDRLVDIEILD